MLLADKNTYEKLATFASIADLNAAIKEHRDQHAEQLTPTIREVLDVIARHSCKYLGVSYLRKNKIAELIGKSRRTVIRACNRLEELGIIEQHELKRVKGDRRQAANAIVIKPIKVDVMPECHAKEAPTKAQSINTLKDTVAPANTLAQALPKEVYEAMSRYFEADDIYKYYGILLRAKRSISRSVMVEDNPEPFVEAFNASIFKHKRGKINNFANYLYNAFQAATARAIRLLGREKLAHDMTWLTS
ncbi:hypothetical protein BpOF4_04545 [Alkalihalophilus pseudofirmus OF4]|uniref:Helix-turn-helix domain-containing protein n=1 Tax=Alkalihalophilus pseudofirmus (strain ATCC BAA-2126 / JCM 17055 / OF4) TaxID=398511 RepID=D3FYU0_ALKPO|nr:helix-turn-helix domain-containing protein [Alkalihalophilus pseudofirmus]ADC48973.1 hypothetical protein BpOF4_04545 [Alkalihalophilus pseudofirmus OF4]